MVRRLVGVGAAAVAIAGCPASHSTTSSHAPPLRLAPCHVPGVDEELRCGSLDVPEDRAHPEGRHLSLPVVVLPAIGRKDRGVPLFELLGGPGAPATSAARPFANELAPLRQFGDVVLVDQRGTGLGPSSLACPALDDAPVTVSLDPAAARRCRESLAARADLRFYGTIDVVRDLDDARRALGYDRINLEGISYGTRVAQVYLRMFSDHVNAVVLFGTLAMDVHVPSEFAENAQRVTDDIIAECGRDARCSRAYPDLRAQLAAALQSLPGRIDRTAFTEWVRHRIYSVDGASALPQLISRAAAGDVTAFVQAAAPPAGFRNAVLLAVTCSEDIPATDAEAALTRARSTWFGAGRLESQIAACDGWPRALVPAGFYHPVVTDVPVLAITGGRDPVTPAQYAKRATRHMRRAQVVHIPALGHELDGLIGMDCIDRLEQSFFRDPFSALDTSCVATTKAPEFTIVP